MPSPTVVLDIARSLPAWNPAGERAELETLVRNVRAAFHALEAGERGAAVARAAFELRKADPQDPEKRPEFDALPAQERSRLAQVAGQVQAESVRRGLIPETVGAGVKGTRRGD